MFQKSAKEIVETIAEIAEKKAELINKNAFLTVLHEGEKRKVEITKKNGIEIAPQKTKQMWQKAKCNISNKKRILYSTNRCVIT